MREIFKLLSYLWRLFRSIGASRLRITAAVLAGVVSGASYPALLGLISKALSRTPDRAVLYGFVALCFVGPTTRLVSQGLFDLIGARTLFEIRLQLCRRILAAPLRKLEAIGPPRLLASLTNDVTTLSTALTQIPALIMHVAIALACVFYMAWLSWPLLLLVIGVAVLGATSFRLPMRRINLEFRRAREETDAQFVHFRSLVEGSKELKLNRHRREIFLSSELEATGEAIRRSTFLGSALSTAATVWGNVLFFACVGIFLFSASGRADLRTLAGFTLALLYIRTPLEVLLQSYPNLSRAAASAGKLRDLGVELTSSRSDLGAGDGLPGPTGGSIELAEVTYAYQERDGEGFGIGPIGLTFQPCELVFLIGSNGSGKTTLAKILTGLYAPDSGEIRIGGEPVTDANRDEYRQRFSAVFADFHLFADLSGLARPGFEEAAREYLVKLRLDQKVKIEDGRLSTLDLSQGQRKRLALLAAYLEDRPNYFFDEWAADQDPEYKAIFYLEILPQLKARGKTVFVISHDDQYYGLGDRLIKLNYGQVEWDRPGKEATRASPSYSG